MLPRPRALPAGFIAPCLPINAPQPPSGEQWLHEIKHDGFRIIARKDGKRVKLYSRPGNDLTYRFPLIVEAIAKLRSRSCIIDGEAVARGEDRIASFDRIRYRHDDDGVKAAKRLITREPTPPDTIALHLALKIPDRQAILETTAVTERLEKVLGLMESEISVLQVEKRIRSRIKAADGEDPARVFSQRADEGDPERYRRREGLRRVRRDRAQDQEDQVLEGGA
jgi:ATP dependent DNA ligase domain